MKTIIVATDFSGTAMNAANFAADMAMSINAELVLLHVFQIPVVYLEVPIAVNLQAMTEDINISLSVVKKKLRARTEGKVKITTRILTGQFFYELDRLAKQTKPYAVLMGSKGNSVATQLFFGRRTLFAMRHLDWPVISVPFEAKFHNIKKICLACDYDQVTDNTPVEELRDLLNDFKAELHVVYAAKGEAYPAEIEESGLLQELLLPLHPKYHFIPHANAEETIIDFVEKNEIDLLITLPKKRALFNHLLHKSFSKGLILYSQVPVIALHTSKIY